MMDGCYQPLLGYRTLIENGKVEGFARRLLLYRA